MRIEMIIYQLEKLNINSTVVNYAIVEQKLVSAFFAPTTQCGDINEKLI